MKAARRVGVRARERSSPIARGPSVRRSLAEIRGTLAPERAFDPNEHALTVRLRASDYAELTILAPLVCELREVAPNAPSTSGRRSRNPPKHPHSSSAIRRAAFHGDARTTLAGRVPPAESAATAAMIESVIEKRGFRALPDKDYDELRWTWPMLMTAARIRTCGLPQ